MVRIKRIGEAPRELATDPIFVGVGRDDAERNKGRERSEGVERGGREPRGVAPVGVGCGWGAGARGVVGFDDSVLLDVDVLGVGVLFSDGVAAGGRPSTARRWGRACGLGAEALEVKGLEGVQSRAADRIVHEGLQQSHVFGRASIRLADNWQYRSLALQSPEHLQVQIVVKTSIRSCWSGSGVAIQLRSQFPSTLLERLIKPARIKEVDNAVNMRILHTGCTHNLCFLVEGLFELALDESRDFAKLEVNDRVFERDGVPESEANAFAVDFGLEEGLGEGAAGGGFKDERSGRAGAVGSGGFRIGGFGFGGERVLKELQEGGLA